MKRLFLAVLVLVPGLAHAQLPGLLNDVLRSVAKPAPASQDAPSAPAAPGPALLGETTLEEELSIGRQLAGHLLGAAPLVKDDNLQRYVNRVGRWVAAQGERPDLAWRFGVLESEDLNAFALPGGYVFVTRGLLVLMRNEAELAGVLGHEIAHVNLRHHLKLYKQGQAISIVGGLIGQRSERSAAAQLLLGKGAEALTRGLDKDAEFEADRAGVVLATRAGYAPYGLPGVLRTLGERNPREASLALLFKTHPLPQERLERLGDAMGDSFDRFADGKTLAARFKRLH
jgi:beta-barrel assembly-enhancing protease